MAVTFEELKTGLAKYKAVRDLQDFNATINFQFDNPPPPLPKYCRDCGKCYDDGEKHRGCWEDIEKTIDWMVKDGYQDWSLKGTCPNCQEKQDKKYFDGLRAKGVFLAEEDDEDSEEVEEAGGGIASTNKHNSKGEER